MSHARARSTGRRRLRPALTLALALAAIAPCRPAAAQQATMRTQFSWRLMDFVVSGDSARGVILMASPALYARQSAAGMVFTDLQFDPDSLRDWIAAARTLRDPASGAGVPRGQSYGPPPLRDVRGRRYLHAARRAGAGDYDDPIVLAVVDSTAADRAWRTNGRPWQLDSLLTLLAGAGARSSRLPQPDADSLDGEVDQPAQVQHQGKLRYPRSKTRYLGGRVWAQYLVDTLGRVDPSSLEVLFSTDTAYVSAVRDMLAATTFVPARRGGAPVRQLVRQVFNFVNW